MDWVEVEAKTVDLAVSEGMKELGITDREFAQVEILQEPETSLLSKIGLGGKPARVIVRKKSQRKRSRNRNRKREADTKSGGGQQQRDSGSTGGGQQRGKQANKPNNGGRNQKERSPGGSGGQRNRNSEHSNEGREKSESKVEDKEIIVTNEEQAEVVKVFLEGLLGAFGLEGTVEASVEDGTIIADVQGEQTEALVGSKGSIMHAVNELTRTVVQRRTHESVRLRLDIAGFGAQRREALAIYAQRLAEQVKDDGAEIMLEPMNAGDRKVIHDAVSDIEGVASYSEGDEPRRSVVLSPEG